MSRRPSRALHLALFAGIASACFFQTSFVRAGETASIPWRDSFERARAEAREANRPLWVQFTGPWCPFCVRMDRETLAKPEIAAEARSSFVVVKVQSDAREDLVERYEIGGLPATLVLSPSGKVLGKHEGFAEVAEFRSFLSSARAKLENTKTQASKSPELALAGYCPVSLVQGRGLNPGRQDLIVRYDGREYRFADEAERDAFLKQPEVFLPANGGRCPVRQVEDGVSVAGRPEFGVYYGNRLYLCSGEAARRKFAEDPRRYSDADLADRGFCPHCRGTAGRLVRGLPQFAATHGGRRYLFPDRSHLEAFRASPDRYVR